MRFFRFPTKRPDICDKWVVNCANLNSSLEGFPESALASRIVCELHFEKPCFTSTKKKCKLVKDSYNI